MPGTIRSVLRGERPVIRSDGSIVRDYFYVEDGAAAYMLPGREARRPTPELRGEAFNFSNEIQLTVLELVERILSADGFRPRAGRAQRSAPRDPAPVPELRQGARRCSAGSRCSRSTTACSGRSRGTGLLRGGRRDSVTGHAAPAAASRLALILVARPHAARERAADARAAGRARADATRSTWRSARHCTLVQITETVPPEELFRDYLYFSSFSDTMLRARARRWPQRLTSRAALRPDSLVDRDRQQRRLPAAVLQARGRSGARHRAGDATSRRWRASSAASPRSPSSSARPGAAARREGERADVIHANNVLAHVAD